MICLEILRRAQKSTWWRTVEAQILPCSSGAYRRTHKGRRHHWGARRKARGGARWKLKSCPAQVELTEAPAKAADIIGARARRKARGGARWKLKSCPAQVELTEAPAKAAGLGGSHQQPPTPQNTHAHKNCQQEPFFRGISEAIRAHILATEVPEQESVRKSHRNTGIYAGSRASLDSFAASPDGFESSDFVASPEPFEPSKRGSGYEVVDSRELARRWRVPKTWVEEQTRRRCSDPVPHIRLGKYVRFEWGSP